MNKKALFNYPHSLSFLLVLLKSILILRLIGSVFLLLSVSANVTCMKQETREDVHMSFSLHIHQRNTNTQGKRYQTIAKNKTHNVKGVN